MVYKVKNAADFQQQLSEAGDKLVVVDFFASWCGPCKFIGPKVEALASLAQYSNVVFLKVDVDECEEVTETYKINSMPTFCFIKNMALVESFSGANEQKLVELVDKHSSA